MLQDLFADCKRRSNKKITERFEDALKKVFPGVERDYVATRVEGVVKKWVVEGLGRSTKEYFIKSETWDEGKALETAVSVFAPHLLKAEVSSGLEEFLGN